MFPDSIWRQSLVAWSKINYRWPQSKAQVMSQIIWYNSDVCIQSSPIWWKRWFENGVLFVSDLFDENGCLIGFDKIPQRPNKLLWLDWLSLQKSIPHMWYCWMKDGEFGEKEINLFNKFSEMSKISKQAYDMLIKDEMAAIKYVKSWEKDGLLFEYPVYQKSFSDLYKITKITKLRDFQYRLLLNKLVTNVHLYEWGRTDSELCQFC